MTRSLYISFTDRHMQKLHNYFCCAVYYWYTLHNEHFDKRNGNIINKKNVDFAWKKKLILWSELCVTEKQHLLTAAHSFIGKTSYQILLIEPQHRANTAKAPYKIWIPSGQIEFIYTNCNQIYLKFTFEQMLYC